MGDKKNMAIHFFYYLILIVFTILSWAFVDANATLPRITSLYPIIYFKTLYPTVWYTVTVAILFAWYFWTIYRVRKGFLTSKHVWYLIISSVAILMWAYPALSNDIFNYIATAKVTFLYRENPYIIMPIDIPNEPSFTFLHAANKVALYGPVWIALTFIPYFLGAGNLLVTLFTFKIFIIAWYIFLCYLIWVASGKKAAALAFFALNPLVTLSTLVDGHNDVMMMFLALLSFYLLEKKQYIGSVISILLSIYIKYATIFLLPVYLYSLISSTCGKRVNIKSQWVWCSIAMYLIFFLSPIREEIYAWYFIWPLTFLALIDRPTILHAASYGFSFGLMFRIAPFFYTRSWSGMTPLVKKIVTFVPPLISTLIYGKASRR